MGTVLREMEQCTVPPAPVQKWIYEQVMLDPYLFHKIVMVNVHAELLVTVQRRGKRSMAPFSRVDARVGMPMARRSRDPALPIRISRGAYQPSPVPGDDYTSATCCICAQECVGAGCADRFYMMSMDSREPRDPDDYECIFIPICYPCLEVTSMGDSTVVTVGSSGDSVQRWYVDSMFIVND